MSSTHRSRAAAVRRDGACRRPRRYSTLLTDDFDGTVSAGMPHGVGGEHRGAVDMITGVWARIARGRTTSHVDPLDYLPRRR